jgi:hypothetical protein
VCGLCGEGDWLPKKYTVRVLAEDRSKQRRSVAAVDGAFSLAGLTISEAYAALKAGKAVKRSCWTMGHRLRGDVKTTDDVCLCKEVAEDYRPNRDEVLASDWQIVSDVKDA